MSTRSLPASAQSFLPLLALALLAACGEATNSHLPDAGSSECQTIAAHCPSMSDCTAIQGDCSDPQLAGVISCLESWSWACDVGTVADCYASEGCTYGATPPVCGDGVCRPSEVGSCLDDCPAPTCGHDECTTGTPLADTCTGCTTNVCLEDPYCCTVEWDSNCVMAAQTYCLLCL